jgi:outer membrane lipoprotein-sorting protein
MKKILVVIFSLGFLSVSAQYDKKAKEILDKVSAKNKAYTTERVEFLYIQENINDKTRNVKNGTLLLKASKYKLDLMGNSILCDSKTIWSYMKETNEVNISNVADQEGSLLNPAKVFTMYEKGFKYKFIRDKFEDNRSVYEIELYPEKVNESQFSKVRLLVDKDKTQLYLVQYFAKDANRVTIEIQKITPNEAAADNVFTFDKTKYPKVEVVDMRQ